jgi:class 3 adenylate cyclase
MHTALTYPQVGDSYMLVGGAPEQRPDHAEAVAAAALEIRATVPLLQVSKAHVVVHARVTISLFKPCML